MKITASSLLGLTAKVRFRKALEGGLIEPLRHAAAEMIQYPWLCKLARLKLQVVDSCMNIAVCCVRV